MHIAARTALLAMVLHGHGPARQSDTGQPVNLAPVFQIQMPILADIAPKILSIQQTKRRSNKASLPTSLASLATKSGTSRYYAGTNARIRCDLSHH